MAWLALGTTTRELRDGDLIVGSGTDADWRIGTADLMPRHFVVTFAGDGAKIRASSDDHVLVLNGRQIAGLHPLSDGDVVMAGSGRFSFTRAEPSSPATAEAPAQPGYLVDDQVKIAHPLSGRSTPIGRDASNAIVVRDPTASRFHAEVRREAGGFALHSMGARGTMLNDKPLTTPRVMSEGDIVEIAFTMLRFTTAPLGREIKLAAPHSTTNDEAGRKPTVAGGVQIVDEDNAAGRQTRRLQLFALIVVAAAALLWWRLSS